MSIWKQLRAILLLPGTVLGIVPAALIWLSGGPQLAWGLPSPWSWLILTVGCAAAALGLLLWWQTTRLFATVGRGTLAPWDPTQRLVVVGIYRYVRNPMISGVGFALCGEVLILGRAQLLLWLGCFAIANACYIPWAEEPGLTRRFGAAYERYCSHVPRWIPRWSAWDSSASEAEK